MSKKCRNNGCETNMKGAFMAEEIDISKLHGIIKEYALAVDCDSKGRKGYGKLNTIQELNLFKEMVIRNGKQKELKKQLPNLKGVSVPDNSKTIKTETSEINNRILKLMKEDDIDSQNKMREAVSEKLTKKSYKNTPSQDV